MSTYAEEHSARLRAMYAVPGRRKARLSAAGRNILRMLGPYPWEGGHGDLTVNGQNVSWSSAYDSIILTQSQAPGFPAGDRKRILAAYGDAARGEHRVKPSRNRRTRRRLGPQVELGQVSLYGLLVLVVVVIVVVVILRAAGII